MAENQAQADQTDETPVVDPLDATNSHNGTTELASYEDEIEAMKQGGEIHFGDDEEQEESAFDETEETLEDIADDLADETAEDEEEEEQQAKASKRIRVNAEGQAIHAIQLEKGCTWVEAARIYSGEQPQVRAEESTQETQQAAPSANLAAVEAEIKELRSKYAEATRAIDVDTQAELFEQIEEKRDQLANLKILEAEQSARAKQTQLEKAQQDFDATWDFSRSRYPELNDPNSAMYKEVARLDAEMQEIGDPLANDPKRLWDLAKRAGLNTRTPMTKPRESSAPSKGKTGSPVKPASGNRGTTSADSNQKFEQKVEGLQTLDAYEEEVRTMLGRS